MLLKVIQFTNSLDCLTRILLLWLSIGTMINMVEKIKFKVLVFLVKMNVQ